jgi:hypothetical protein
MRLTHCTFTGVNLTLARKFPGLDTGAHPTETSLAMSAAGETSIQVYGLCATRQANLKAAHDDQVHIGTPRLLETVAILCDNAAKPI